jgi:hypothetical protein
LVVSWRRFGYVVHRSQSLLLGGLASGPDGRRKAAPQTSEIMQVLTSELLSVLLSELILKLMWALMR